VDDDALRAGEGVHLRQRFFFTVIRADVQHLHAESLFERFEPDVADVCRLAFLEKLVVRPSLRRA
jgi:hypothetical protein